MAVAGRGPLRLALTRPDVNAATWRRLARADLNANAAAWRRLALAGLAALALLGLGEAAPGAFPVQVTIEAQGEHLAVMVDGAEHELTSAFGGGWTGLVLEQPGPGQREYQVDGSDTTATGDRDLRLLDGLLNTPLYRLDAWLRDEASFSRWESVRLTDLATGQTLPVEPGTSLDHLDDRGADLLARRPADAPPEQEVAGHGALVGIGDPAAAVIGPAPTQASQILSSVEAGSSPSVERGSTGLARSVQPGSSFRAATVEPVPTGLASLAQPGSSLPTGSVDSGSTGLAAAVRTGSSLPTGSTDPRPVVTAGEVAGSPLPAAFRLELGLRRPEAPARVWLVGPTAGQREGLELDRDRRNARWLIDRGASGGGQVALPRWFFPEQPLPFAADLLHLLGRSAMAGYALVVASLLAGHLVRRTTPMRLRVTRLPRLEPRLVADLLLAGWLVAAALVSVRLYHQLPHILDAVSYTFQAGLLSGGRFWLPVPPAVDAFRGPFEVLWQGRWFSQYPPGAPTAYALGRLLGLDWLVGPLASVALIGATSWTAGALFGSGVGLVVLGFGVLSPFVLFQAGAFLSHPIAGGLLAGALAAFVAAERGSEVIQTDPSPPGLAGSRGSLRPLAWYAAAGGLLGAGFLVREAASVLFAVPLVARMLSERRWRGLACLIGGGLPFLLIYFAYNAALTGSPLLLPRSIFDPTDRFGFGDGLGFHHRHTLAAGLANTDELLTLLQFDLFGWPPLFSLGLIGLPFLLGRARAWDVLAAGGFLAFVVAYAAYFYHGVALGPRYYYEALPWLLLLAGRGTQVLVELARSRLAVSTILGLLSLNTLLFYLPAELSRRTDFSALPDGRRLEVAFVQTSLLGPRLVGVESPSLVLTDDWWLYNAVLAPLNCPRLPDCPVLFGLAPTPDDARALRATYPGRMPLRVVDRAGRLELEPQPEAP